MTERRFEQSIDPSIEEFMEDLRAGVSSGVPAEAPKAPGREAQDSIALNPREALKARIQTLRELAKADSFYEVQVEELEKQFIEEFGED